MKQFIVFLLMLALCVVGFGQNVNPKSQKVKPKTTAKVKKVTKLKPKTKLKPQLTTLEAATKDGKAVTLKSNGTWEYTKTVAAIKPTPTPTVKITPTPKPTPVATPTPKSSPIATPNPSPVVKTTPVPLSTQCDLTLKDSPVIRGLKLGMLREEADKIIPLDRVRILNSSAITAYPQFSNSVGFENVYQITAQFFEEKLSDLQIVYDPSAVKWKDAKEYAENLSENFNIPYRFWKFNAKNAFVSEMQCREFSIKLDSEQNEIRLEKLTESQKTGQIKEDSKKVFKP